MKKTIIVTGSNGQLGKVFVKELAKKGYYVYAVDLITDNNVFNNLQPMNIVDTAMQIVQNK